MFRTCYIQIGHFLQNVHEGRGVRWGRADRLIRLCQQVRMVQMVPVGTASVREGRRALKQNFTRRHVHRSTPSGALAPPLWPWMRTRAPFCWRHTYLRIKMTLWHQVPPKCVLISDIYLSSCENFAPRLLLLPRLFYGIFRSYHFVNENK